MWLHTLNPAMDACALALRLTAAVHVLPKLHRCHDPVLDMLVVRSMLLLAHRVRVLWLALMSDWPASSRRKACFSQRHRAQGRQEVGCEGGGCVGC